ncbi:MAG: hypothetical protein M1822_007492 [Bathelium mastoideum]|nr:MAG: hypothetical protein M1822_007492 [Bathelium mastoideum]
MSWLYLTTIVPPHRLETLATQPTSPLSQSTSFTSPSIQSASSEQAESDTSRKSRVEARNNAFWQLRKERETRFEQHRRDGNFWYNEKQTMAENSAPGKSTTGLRVKVPRIEPEKSPALTTMSPFMAAGEGYATSRLVSPMEDLNLVPEDKANLDLTDRDLIEHKGERRLQRMMGQSSTTPSPIAEGTFSFKDDKSTNSKPDIKTFQYARPKSPTKRFFDKLGIAMPTFYRSNQEMTKIKTMSDNVPPKAAQLLGTSSPEPAKPQIQIAHKTSKSEKKPSASVPTRLSDREKAYRSDVAAPLDPADVAANLPNRTYVTLDQLASARAAARLARPRSQSLKVFDDTDRESLRTGPPTPLIKGTPPNLETLNPPGTGNRSKLMGFLHPSEHADGPSQCEVLVNPGNLSPLRTGGFAVKEHVAAIEKVPSVYSLRAALDISGDNDSKSSLGRHSLRPNGRWSDSEKELAWSTQGLLPGGRLPPTTYCSPANIYSPSIYSTQDASRPESPKLPQSGGYERVIPPCILPPAPHSRNFSDSHRLVSPKLSQATLPVVFCGKADEISPKTGRTTSEPTAFGALRGRSPETALSQISTSFSTHNDMVRARSKSSPSQPISDTVDAEDNIEAGRRDYTTNAPGSLERFRRQDAETPAKLFGKLPSAPNTVETESAPVAPQVAQSADFNPTQFATSTGLLTVKNPVHFAPPQFPSALPTPLYGREEGFATMAECDQSLLPTVLADGSHLLTHFGVINHHLDVVAGRIIDSFSSVRDVDDSSTMRKLEEIAKDGETHYGDLREHLNSIEHNIGRMSGEMETMAKSITELSNAVRGALTSNVQDLTKTNQNLSKQVSGLEKRLTEASQKLGSLQQQVNTSFNSNSSATSQANAGAQNLPVPTSQYMSQFPQSFSYTHTGPQQPVYVPTSSALAQPPTGPSQFPRHLQSNDVRMQPHARRSGHQAGSARQGGGGGGGGEHHQPGHATSSGLQHHQPGVGIGGAPGTGTGSTSGYQHNHQGYGQGQGQGPNANHGRSQTPTPTSQQQQYFQLQMQHAQATGAPDLTQHPAFAGIGGGAQNSWFDGQPGYQWGLGN